jgi:F0F1-type ATP synthase membrane subunit b/b'
MEALKGIQKYLNIIAQYDNEFKKWEARSNKIVKRYRDDNRNQNTNETAKFNILWSNVQTLIPAVYARLPKAAVNRRFGDNDPVGRVASQLIERSLDFEIEHYSDFRSAMRHAVEDRFLGGRGVAWVRYEPHVVAQDMPEDGYQVTEDVDKETGIDNEGNASALDGSAGMEAEPQEEIEYECAPTDYVHWKDFGHSVARTWEEVTQVWRWVYMTREALVERFGEKVGGKIPLDAGPESNKQYAQNNRDFTRAKICELWDIETEKVYWFSKNAGQIIDERDDPLDLEGFFPCAKPLYATMTSDTLVPVADFVLYQDQAQELDILSDRIDGLVKALRVRGVYDASQPALQRLLTEGDNNTLIPVDKWMGFSEKGGLKGSIDILPIDTIANALIQCYRARDEIKKQIYEITGISDIVRGQTAASETATAQQIKGQYAGLRLRSMQEDVALFASELIRLKAQIICSKFQPQTIIQYAAAEQMSDADKQLVPQALMLLKDKVLRNFRIEVAADSLVQIDENQHKRDRVEFLQAMGGFLSQALPMGQQTPELVPMLVDMVKFGISAYKQAEPIEGTIDQAMDQLKQKQAQAAQQPPQPDPEMIKAQAEAQKDQMKMQMDQQREQARTEADMQIEQIKAQSEAALEKQKQDFEAWKVQFEGQNEINVARIKANPGVDVPLLEAQELQSKQLVQQLGASLNDALNRMAQLHEGMMQMQAQTIEQINGVKSMVAAPKRIIRGADGKVAGVEVVQ